MRTARNIAIVMVVAIPVAFTPSGGNVSQAVLTALSMGLLAGIAWLVYVLGRQNQLTLATLSDGRRVVLYAALGLIALLVAGSPRLSASGGGTLLGLLLFAAAIAAIWKIWVDANTYA